jgi:hypothetical protein
MSISANKTLIGKNGYLFLQNDSSNEIKRHETETSNISIDSLNRYDSVQKKYFITVFPNKSFVCRSELPDGYDLKYRSDLNVYKKKFGDYLLDGYTIIRDDIETFYKTDTHMNLRGTLQIYYEFLKKINSLFKLNLKTKKIKIESTAVENLAEYSHGDLTWQSNLGDQILDDRRDVYYFSKEITNLYPLEIVDKKHRVNFFKLENNDLIDCNSSVIGTQFDWNVISKYILHKKNKSDPKYKVLIFYDSFLISTLFLYLDLFDEVYMQKNVFDKNLVTKINPDYIFEFRVERFLF